VVENPLRTCFRDGTELKVFLDVAEPMSSTGPGTTAPQLQESGIKAALKYTGIPQSWLSKRPKVPSRNWLIFIGVTSTVTGYYLYDRRQCKAIRQAYVDKVKHLAETPLHSHDYPRKVMVYGAKWPDDEDSDRAIKYFRKYVKVRA
jgi:import inner membrane translocase subunit TIM54